MGRRVVVIGGGNVAYDVARSAVRPMEAAEQAETLADMGRGEQVAYDVARSALRLSGDKEVHVVCLESRAEMPADEIEMDEGEEEGIFLHNRRGPREVLGRGREGCRACGPCNACRCSTPRGRFSPTFDEAAVEDIAADTLIFAIGQSSDLSFLQPDDGVESERGLIKVNPETYQTTAPDVFACGDIAHGPRLFIDAIASAQIAARSMHDFLRGTRTDVVLRKQWKPAVYTMAEGWQRFERTLRRRWRASKRASSLEIVEESYPEAGSAAAGGAMPALQRQHGFRHGDLRGLQRLRRCLSGEPDPAGGLEPACVARAVSGDGRGSARCCAAGGAGDAG